MRQKICKEICPFCHKNDQTIITSSTQFRCKRCKRYFQKGTTRKEYPREVLIAIRTILELIYGKLTSKKISIRTFVKNFLNKLDATMHDIRISGRTIPRATDSLKPTIFSVDGNLTDSVIITRQKNGFIVTRGLDVRQVIIFNDFIIHTSGRGNISRDYYFGKDDDHYKSNL